MEGAPLELVEGHNHQARDNAFTSLLVVWPTPRRGYWHVWMRRPHSHATEEPLSGDLVPELPEEWGFAAEQWRQPGGRPAADQSRPASPATDSNGGW
jgi:hypothetical protein